MTSRDRAAIGYILLAIVLISSTSAWSIPADYIPPENQPTTETEEATDTMSAVGTVMQVGNAGGDFVLCELARFRFGTFNGSDCWGWEAPDGTEYAIMGTQDGVAFVNATTLEVVDIVTGSGCLWQDMKTYGHYCYAVSECGSGLRVIDLQFLPDSAHLVRIVDISSFGEGSSHSLSVDSVKGFLYAEGVNATNRSIYIHDLSDPANPSYVSGFGNAVGIHDLWVSNDTAYLANGTSPTFSIWYMGNKSSPQLLAQVNIPASGYVHNIWPTDDRRHVITTEETSFKTIKAWNIEDLNNIQLVGQYLAPSNLAHNAHMVGDTLFVSHYESGVEVVDFSDPANPVELFQFDTYPVSETDNFNGCWGVFPHTSSGKVYASNTNGYLYILDTRLVQLDEKLIGDSVVTSPANKVRVDVSIVNDFPIREATIPFGWGGDLNLIFDSVSTSGLRTDYFEVGQWIVFDPANERCAYRIRASSDDSAPDLDPGSGPILSIYFTVPASASGMPNPIELTGIDIVPPQITTDCFSYSPQVTDGYVAIVESTGTKNISLAGATHVLADTIIVPGHTNVFTFRSTNVGSGKNYNISNGFRVYSPDGATWDTLIGSWTNDFDSQFDQVFINYSSPTGSGADTVGFAGIAFDADRGLVDGWDAPGLSISIGPIPLSDSGKHICIDSSWFPSNNPWKWVGLGGTGTDLPTWSGEICYLIGNGSSCCVGRTGNVDGDSGDTVDLGDLTALIDYLFISFAEPPCFEETNVDGSAGGVVDLGDLTALIDYLFISFTPPAECQ